MSGWMGIDLSQYDLDEPIGNVKSNAIQSVVANFQQAAEDGSEWKVRDIGRHGAIGGLGPYIVGSGEEIADQLQVAATACRLSTRERVTALEAVGRQRRSTKGEGRRSAKLQREAVPTRGALYS
jgi:hypothetical protein